MKKSFLFALLSIFSISHNFANPLEIKGETPQKIPVYAEVGLGFGKTLFFGNIREKLKQSYGGSFNPGIGNNLMMGFYISKQNWKGLGLGSRIKGSFGSSVVGDFGDSYIFNYYNLGLSAKYYPVSKQFNKGLYVRASMGFGQFTTKRVNESTNLYRHQYAIGTTFMGGIGYSIPFKKLSVSIESEFEHSNRNGTIDLIGTTSYQSGQIGANIIVSF